MRKGIFWMFENYRYIEKYLLGGRSVIVWYLVDYFGYEDIFLFFISMLWACISKCGFLCSPNICAGVNRRGIGPAHIGYKYEIQKLKELLKARYKTRSNSQRFGGFKNSQMFCLQFLQI